MNKRTYFGGVALVCGAILGAAALNAQDAGNAPAMSPEEQAMMEKWMEYATPGAHHEHLAKKVGTWDLEISHWMAPGAPPETSVATAEISMILGDRYLLEHVQGTTMGMPFEGFGVTGYDNALKVYQNIWIDNFGTGMMTGDAKIVGDDKMEGWSELIDPMTGGPMKMHSVGTDMGDDKFMFEMFTVMPDGSEIADETVAIIDAEGNFVVVAEDVDVSED